MKKRLMQDLHGGGVGAGITLAIFAAQRTNDPESPEAWVHFCVTAAEEAYAAVIEANQHNAKRSSVGQLLYDISDAEEREEIERKEAREPPETAKDAAHHAATMAFRMCMPKLTGRRATQAYIACIAAAVQRGYFTGSEAKSLLYTAQLALSAHPSRGRSKR